MNEYPVCRRGGGKYCILRRYMPSSASYTLGVQIFYSLDYFLWVGICSRPDIHDAMNMV